tara:strand:- start:17 stop:1054 length:1038 start_codon:yes stop_codon:yes gene_type:complete
MSREIKFRECLSYDDVLLVPQYSDIRTRSEVDIGSQMGQTRFAIPIIASPMDTVSGFAMASKMQDFGGFAVLHRYCSIEDQAEAVTKLHAKMGPSAAAVGITGDYLERIAALADAGVDIICLDVAHGHHIVMREAIDNIKNMFDGQFHLMAGNIATIEGFNDLADWGADSIRCNIGGGSICSTRIQTGHGMPGLETILHCAQSDRDAIIIADGGIRNSGDIVKALAAGADFVMLGSLLAGTVEAPGEIIRTKDGEKMKTYRGMASKDAQMDWRGRYSSNEGVSTMVPYAGPVGNILDDLIGGIKSGLSYSGARNIREFQAKSKFIVQTSASQTESGTHISLKAVR